jgi:hypothetical protein
MFNLPHRWLGIGTAFFLLGCVPVQQPYYERYAIKDLTVVLLDQTSLHHRYEEMAGHAAVTLMGSDSSATIGSVRGFFDPRTNTIYCSKMDFAICGHELHHAIIGRFHPE